jgi:hypothetical protein
VEADGPVLQDRAQDGQVFAQPLHSVGRRDAECAALELMAAERDTEAEIAVRGGLSGLRQ